VKRISKVSSALIFFLSSLAVTSSCWAAAEQRLSIGGLIGLGLVNDGGFSATTGTVQDSMELTFGANFIYKVAPQIGVGASFHYMDLGTNSTNLMGFAITSTSKYMFFNALFNYYVDSLSKGFWIGGRVGLVNNTTTSTVATFTGSTTTGALNLGPAIGYDFMLSEMFSVGVDLSYLFANFSGINRNILMGLGAVKVHF
jgi:hypothetical protein